MIRAFKVTAGPHDYVIVAPSGLAALGKAQELHRRGWNEEEDPARYPGFPISFEVKGLGIVDATVREPA